MKEINSILHEDMQIRLAKSILERKGYKVTKELEVGQVAELRVDKVDLGYITLDGLEYRVVNAEDIDMEVEKNPLDVYFTTNTGIVLSLLNTDSDDIKIAKVKRIR